YTNSMAIYLTSDTHYYHKKVLEYCGRPFLTLNQNKEAMIKRWNNTVDHNDIIFHLGDFSFNHNRHKDVVPHLKGYKILILGNHDAGGPGNGSTSRRFEHFKQKYLEAGWQEVHLRYVLQDIDGNSYYLNHFPVQGAGDHTKEERYHKYRYP